MTTEYKKMAEGSVPSTRTDWAKQAELRERTEEALQRAKHAIDRLGQTITKTKNQ